MAETVTAPPAGAYPLHHVGEVTWRWPDRSGAGNMAFRHSRDEFSTRFEPGLRRLRILRLWPANPPCAPRIPLDSHPLRARVCPNCNHQWRESVFRGFGYTNSRRFFPVPGRRRYASQIRYYQDARPGGWLGQPIPVICLVRCPWSTRVLAGGSATLTDMRRREITRTRQ